MYDIIRSKLCYSFETEMLIYSFSERHCPMFTILRLPLQCLFDIKEPLQPFENIFLFFFSCIRIEKKPFFDDNFDFKFVFFRFLYESVHGNLHATTTIHRPAGNSQETKNVQENIFSSIPAFLDMCPGTITMNFWRWSSGISSQGKNESCIFDW